MTANAEWVFLDREPEEWFSQNIKIIGLTHKLNVIDHEILILWNPMR